MNQIANHNSFALPIEQQDFNSHVSLMRSYSLLDIAKYKYKARRARMKAAAFVKSRQVVAPVVTAAEKQIQIRDEIIDQIQVELDERNEQRVQDIVRSYTRHNELIMKYNEVNQIAAGDISKMFEIHEIQLFVLCQNWVYGRRSGKIGEISFNEMISDRRNNKIITFRHIGMYLSKILTTKSLPEIGRKFGGKDHTSVLHACRKVEEAIAAGKLLINGKKFDPELLEIKL
jgi:chromosomal replication initiation ATPase DnaA